MDKAYKRVIFAQKTAERLNYFDFLSCFLNKIRVKKNVFTTKKYFLFC